MHSCVLLHNFLIPSLKVLQPKLQNAPLGLHLDRSSVVQLVHSQLPCMSNRWQADSTLVMSLSSQINFAETWTGSEELL